VAKVIVIDNLVAGLGQYAGGSTLDELFIFRAPNTFTLITAEITQLGAGVSGTLEVDVLKGTSLSAMSTVFSTKPSLEANGSTITIVDYTLLSGDTVTVTINGVPTVLTEGSEWTASVSNTSTSISLAAAIDGLTGVTVPVPAGAAMVLDADDTNQITLTGSDLVNLTISDTGIAGDNTTSTNGVFSAGAITENDWIRLDVTAIQVGQQRVQIRLIGES